jgi:excisionase family DNA binding protein
MTELNEILSLTEAAEVAGVSAGRLRQLIEEGRLRGKKIGNSWAILNRDLDTFLGRQRGAGRPDEKASLASRLFIDLRGNSPIQINLTGNLPDISLWFKADNRSSLEVELDRLLVEVWLGQPFAEGAVLHRHVLRPNSWDDSVWFHQFLSRDRVEMLVQRLTDSRGQGGATDLRLQLTAHFNSPFGTVTIYNNMIQRQKGEFPIQLPPSSPAT